MSETSGEDELREMFRRLNRYLTSLSPQELRHATYTGPFEKLAEQLAEDEYWLKSGLVTRALVRRLGDVEFVGQLLIGTLHGPQGGSAAIVDEFYRSYEDFDVDEGFPDQRRTVRLFGLAKAAVADLFPTLGDDDSLRWGNRADYYSLFVALAEVLRDEARWSRKQTSVLRDELTLFSADVNKRLAREDARVSRPVVDYVSAVEKGVNDKARRAERHRILVDLVHKTLGSGAKEARSRISTSRGS